MYVYVNSRYLLAFRLLSRNTQTQRSRTGRSASVRTTDMMALKAAGPAQATAAKPGGVGMEPVVGSLTAGKKNREYKVTNRLQEGKRPLYAICFNLIDSRFHNVFASAGCNRVPECRQSHPPTRPCFFFLGAYAFESLGMSQWRIFPLFMSGSWVFLFAQMQVTVYQCLTEGGAVAVLHTFIDEDVCAHNLLYLSPMGFCCCRGGEDIGFEIASEHLRRIAIKV